MELRHLRYLVAVADAGTFVAAAQLIRVAQPALTRQLRDLANELGVELFDKSARKATLTKAGEACVRLARHVIQGTERAMQQARLANEGLVGECRVLVGAIPMASGMAGRLIARTKAKYPGIKLIIEEGEGTTQWERLANGDGDVGLSITPPVTYPSIAIETQAVDTVSHALLHPDHPMAARRSVKVAELAIFPSLMVEGAPKTALGGLVREYVLAVEKLGRGAPVIEYHPTLHALLAHVRAMQGWLFIPTSVRNEFKPLVAVPITDYKMPLVVSRLWRRADDRPVVRTVIDELRLMALEEAGAKETTPRRAPKARRPDTPLPSRLELRHLRSYVQVARVGSLGRAAEALDITQPALSRQMKDLEYDVGVSLFARGTRGVELTVPGHSFLADVTGVLAVAEQINKEAHRAERGAAQACVIGVVPHPHFDHLVADLVADLQSSRMKIATRVLGTPSMPAALERSEIDLALGFAYPVRVPPNPSLTRVRLFDDRMNYALLAPTHELAQSETLSTADLADVPFLFPPREIFPPFHSVVMHEFDRCGVQPRIDNTYEGVVTIWAVTAQGLGWALGLEAQAKDPPMGLKAIPLRDFRLPWGGELVYRKDESRASVLAAIDSIVARAKQLFGVPARL